LSKSVREENRAKQQCCRNKPFHISSIPTTKSDGIVLRGDWVG